jgi:hypothetical protein
MASLIAYFSSIVMRCSRSCLLIFVTISLLISAVAFAQSGIPSSQDSQNHASGDHGLILVLTQDQIPEPSDSSGFKSCLAHHPPLACVLLTLVLKNEGKETVLHWSSTCGGAGIGFDLRKPDGNWEPFPTDEPSACSATVLVVESLLPGKSSVVHFRLADLELDTAFPSDDGTLHPHKGFALITGPGQYTIRANWSIWGCSTSEKLEGGALYPTTAVSMCAHGTKPEQGFALLRSNELSVTIKP